MTHKVKTGVSKRAKLLYSNASLRSGDKFDRLLRILNSAVDAIDDRDRFIKHMQLLASSVVFTENPVLAFRMLHVYRFCEYAVKKGNTEEALILIKRLRTIVMMMVKSR